MQNELKYKAALQALKFVKDGMKIGIGTGSTANYFIDLLGNKVREGLDIIGVPTSIETQNRAEQRGIPLATLDEIPELDITIDGADELDHHLRLIKGGGGALLREKIVAFSSKELVIIADETKLVNALGKFPLPVEVVPFGLKSTFLQIQKIAQEINPHARLSMRMKNESEFFITDGGHYIIDMHLEEFTSPEELSMKLSLLPGVVDHGLFIGLAKRALVATSIDIYEIS